MTRLFFLFPLLAALFAIKVSAAGGEPQVAWLAEAVRTGRPILLVSGLACLHQVPGIW